MLPSKSTTLSIARRFILWGMSLLAGFTVLTHGFQLLGFSFRTYSWTLAVFSGVLTITFLATQIQKNDLEPNPRDFRVLVGLVILCLAGVLLAVLSYRPDLDDYYYAPNALYYLQHPGTAMGFEIHFIESQTRITSLSWGTSLPYEYSRAAFAYLTGIDFLSVYYFVTAGIVGGLIPLAYFYLLSQFTSNPLKSAFGTFIALSILSFMGDTHRAPGNFAFVRAFQGKALLLSAGVPILAGATIEFFQRRSIQAWLLVLATTTGLIGTSASAAVILPALGSVVGLTLLLQQESWREILSCSFRYGTAYAYLFAYAAFILIYSADNLGMDSPVNEGWPTTFLGHLSFFINPYQPTSPLVITVGTGFALLYFEGKRREIFSLWALLFLVIYFNPFVADFYIRYITSPNIYWRMAYIYPGILALGAMGFWGFDWLRTYSRQIQIGAFVGIMIAVVAAHLPWFSSSTFQSNVQWFPLEYPIRGDYYTARQITENVPNGAMLAPYSLSGPVALASSTHPQMRVRSDGVLLWLGRKRAQRRISASKYVGGNGGSLQDFREVIQKSSVCSAVISDSIADKSQVRSILSSQGYRPGQEIGEYVVHSRQSRYQSACASNTVSPEN